MLQRECEIGEGDAERSELRLGEWVRVCSEEVDDGAGRGVSREIDIGEGSMFRGDRRCNWRSRLRFWWKVDSHCCVFALLDRGRNDVFGKYESTFRDLLEYPLYRDDSSSSCKRCEVGSNVSWSCFGERDVVEVAFKP